MRPDDNMNEDLLVKHLLGETSEAEQQEVKSWIAESDTNRKQYEQFRTIWEASKEVEAKSTVNVEQAWERFKERTAGAEGERQTIELPARRLSWVRAAAIIVVLLGAGYMVYNFGFNDSGKLMAVNSGNAVLIDTLPDGSVVTLNKNSSLSYNSKLDGKTRWVKLEGEAFFNVAPDKEHPFVIDVNGNTVTVVGTSFNIKTSNEKTEVIVATGIVDVAKKDNRVTLHPNEKATILLDKDAPIKEEYEDELYNYYKTKEFVCRKTPVVKLAEVLSQAYEKDIVIENQRLQTITITTTFEFTDDLDAALHVLESHGVQVSKVGDRYILQ